MARPKKVVEKVEEVEEVVRPADDEEKSTEGYYDHLEEKAGRVGKNGKPLISSGKDWELTRN
jgi:hypothetical protein